jgi:hypothetical protein
MWRCKAETKVGSSEIAAPSPRGLELLKLSGERYANGASAAISTLHPADLVPCSTRHPVKTKALSLFVDRSRVHARALCLWLLPVLSLAAIVWLAINMAGAGQRGWSFGAGHSQAAGPVSRVVDKDNLSGSSTAQTGSSVIIIHKVKTERIESDPAR